ncbi:MULTISPECIES: TetR family transcriptional regulator [unclassified Leifsonia]|uniref:acyl-CoA-like ligand-binding transcription factor n=1 Tax=unclassified Leifsonia TaxID=2663824 RepID=UPI0008A77652|nr:MULTISPECIES: TetR family transcriptional regulator [unclassified Leifsonia]SEH74721.1 DNA-binding transcriptional regulator, AcrR family [Leifsonia sp. CL154]SFL36259.1 DNA-binding transcriptional regulator, AcrR family [Leifsonia sp. CL147]
MTWSDSLAAASPSGGDSPDAAPAPTRRRGRPADVDPERVALLALRHFDEHGYEQTTMDDIARLAGIGRRTLFRYFPSKPALVWGGIEPVVGRMHAVLDAAGDDETTRDVLERAVSESLAMTPEAEEATRRRMTLMGTHPALIAFGLTAIAANRHVLVEFLARRLEADPSSLRVQVLADALGSADFSALLWWARHSDGSPAEVVLAAMDELLRGI